LVLVLSDPGWGALCAAGSALSWAAIGLLVRALSPTFNSVTLNAVRSTLGGGLVCGWVAITGGLPGVTRMSGTAFALLSGSVVLAIWLGDTAFFESTRALGLCRAMTVSMTYPLISAVLAAMFLDEALTLKVGAGSLVTLGGLALTVSARETSAIAARAHFWLGIGAATLASLAWAASVILLKPSLAEVDAVHAQVVRLPVAAAFLWATPWAWKTATPLRHQGAATLWCLLALAALTAISSIMFVAGVRYAGVAVATVLSSTAPLFAIPLEFVFLGERLAPRVVTGALVTVLGIAMLEL
jgi:drug/metabolite transporter (DMT)-like permease